MIRLPQLRQFSVGLPRTVTLILGLCIFVAAPDSRAQADQLKSFFIEATPPANVGEDLGVDFSNCDGIGDGFGDFVDFPINDPNVASGGVQVHDSVGIVGLQSYRDPAWWRGDPITMTPNLMTMSGSEVVDEPANRGAIHWNNGLNDFPETASFFQDGGFRPHLAADKPPNGTVRFGPLQFDDVRQRRFADVSSTDMLLDGVVPQGLEVTYGNNESALIFVEQVTPEKTRFRVQIGYSPDPNGLLFEITTMFRDDMVNDAALIRGVDGQGNEIQSAVLDFPDGQYQEIFLFREQPSQHNSLGPDIRIGEFMFEDDDGNLYQGALTVVNESRPTDCAEDDNVVLSFIIPEPSTLTLV